MSTKTKLAIFGIVALVLLVVGAIVGRVALPAIIVAPEPVGSFFGLFPLTNTIVAAWFAMVVLLIISWAVTRNLQMVPGGLQNLFEAIIEAFLRPVEAVAGPANARRFFPLVFTIFIFVMISNWMGLLPGFGTIGIIEPGHAHDSVHPVTTNIAGAQLSVVPYGPKEGVGVSDEHHEPLQAGPGEVVGTFVPFLRGATTDLNMTLAIALVAMAFVEYMGFKTLGFAGYGGKFVNVGAFKQNGPMMGVIFFFVGLLEIIAEIARVISFSFRLFGNIFAGEVLLVVIAFLLPWVATVPFLGLELFVGFIQAFVFAMLTVVFAATAMISHGDHDDHHPEHGHGEAVAATTAHH